MKEKKPPTLGEHEVFYSNASGRKIYVPAESVNTYKAASGWGFLCIRYSSNTNNITDFFI